jgi:hypothetical protein
MTSARSVPAGGAADPRGPAQDARRLPYSDRADDGAGRSVDDLLLDAHEHIRRLDLALSAAVPVTDEAGPPNSAPMAPVTGDPAD